MGYITYAGGAYAGPHIVFWVRINVIRPRAFRDTEPRHIFRPKPKWL
jgi:hypothetical protein